MSKHITIDHTIKRAGPGGEAISFPIHGCCDEKFLPVVEAFNTNFADASEVEELGASACVMLNGATVVDLWGGYRDAARNNPWVADTIVCMMSVGKAIGGTAMNMLVDRGLVDLDAPVAKYWPEFAQAGKEKIPVRYILDHRAGLPVVSEPLWKGAIYDWDAMTGALARQAPLWEPGTKAGYPTLTMGYLVGEVVRRVTGKKFPQFVRDEITGPLKMDYNFALTASEEARCSEFLYQIEGTSFDPKFAPSQLGIQALAQVPDGQAFDSPEWKRADISSANGHGNARAIARFYQALVQGGKLEGACLMSPEAVKRMTTEQHRLKEIVVMREYHQGLGILLNTPLYATYGPNPNSFGSHGWGGPMGFGDPDAKLSFSYSMNTCHRMPGNGPRSRRLWKAAYDCL